MTEHTTGTRDEWDAAHEKLLEREQKLTKLGEELKRERRELPWVPVEKEYTFDTDEGTKTLVELFDGSSELLIYHLMFGPDWIAACPFCSALADHLDGTLAHLNARDVTLIGMSRAPLEKIQAYKQRMGWTFPYVSAFGSDFNFDFGSSFTGEQQRKIAEKVLPGFENDAMVAEAADSVGTDLEGYVTTEGPGLRALALEDGVVYHTYFTQQVNFIVLFDQLLDRAPKGGKEGVTMGRHDEYEQAGAGALS
jgi:predicted dithiol-disulfide oxidoreductase (DUF899 family)